MKIIGLLLISLLGYIFASMIPHLDLLSWACGIIIGALSANLLWVIK